MTDYNLSALGPREFEHLTQALAMRILAPGVTPFGDGPDGGREASFRGAVRYPSEIEPWNGYLVIQCKYKQRSAGAKKDGQWALEQLKAELKQYTKPDSKRDNPEFYIFVTNVVLTPAPEKGAKDKARAMISAVAEEIGLKGFDVWDYDTVCRYLDTQPEVRRSFAALITPHDVLSELLTFLPDKSRRPELERTLTLYLQRELRRSQFVRLEQAGLAIEQRTPLARVFVDLPFSQPFEIDSEGSPGIVAAVLTTGRAILKPSMRADRLGKARNSPARGVSLARASGGLVIVGGPGQGKSTAVQFVCQLHRAAFLRERPREMLNPDTLSAMEDLSEQCLLEGIKQPTHRRFPINIILERFAAALARGETGSVLQFLASQIADVTECIITVDDLRAWLSVSSWLVILDGLDEVPATSNRTAVLEKVAGFRDELAALDADVQIVATTRPQGYGKEFSPAQFAHLHLEPLSPAHAIHYAQRLTNVRHVHDPRRAREVMDRLSRAIAENATARLMETPLQVTLMATLVEQIGEPPRERWRLFHQYYNAVYAREIERDIATSRLLQGRRADIDAIHHRVGLLLQTEGELPSTDNETARLSAPRFGSLVRDRLLENGVEGDALQTLACELEKAATERLVFLVQPEEERVGFEIRSLQEFSAAEALLTGREAHVRARLSAIAPIPYWRNVFLFAAGRCFADTQHQHLREDLLEICDELNRTDTDSLTAALLEGARLALDILSDGVAREQPRYGRWLAERALKLLGRPLPPVSAVGGEEPDPLEHLANAYDPPLRSVYEEAIGLRLNQSRLAHRLGAWSLLSRLSDKQIDWAIRLADDHWPEDAGEQTEILLSFPWPINGAWSLPRLIKYISVARPEQLERFHLHLSAEAEEGDDNDSPQWLRALGASIRGYAVDADHGFIAPRSLNPELELDGVVLGRFVLNSGFGEFATYVKHALHAPLNGRDWDMYRAALRFTVTPSHEHLEAALRAAAERGGAGINASVLKWVGWPLRVCLEAANDAAELEVLADSAQIGKLGSVDDWRAAEQRWRSGRISWSDLCLDLDHSLPLGPWIAERGFPLRSAGLRFNGPDTDLYFAPLWNLWTRLPAGPTREAVAALCLRALAGTDPHELEEPLAEIPDYILAVSPNQLIALLEAAPKAAFFLRILDHVDFESEGSSDVKWLDFFECLGRDPRDILINFDLDRWWAAKWSWTERLCTAFNAEPSRIGLLHVLGAFAVLGAELSVSSDALKGYQTSRDAEVLEALIALDLGQGFWDDETRKRIARRAVELSAASPKGGERLGYLLIAIAHQAASDNEKEALVLAMREQVLASSALYPELGRFTSYLQSLLNHRVSALQTQETWRRLGLPDLPAPTE